MKTVSLFRPGTVENACIPAMPWSEIDRVMESFLGNSFLTPSERIFTHAPSVDVRETEKAYVLEAELPGYDEKEIEVNLENSILTIASKREEEKEEKKGEEYLIRERRSSSFSRSFKLPANADPEGIRAAFRNGILSLEISKKAEAAKKLIQISRD